MTSSPQSDPQAERLLKALEQQPDLTCEEAQAQLSELVEAELAGVNVDLLPRFAALLRHLDTCEADCLGLYADLSEKMAELAGLALKPVAAPRSAEMPIFEKVRESVFATVLMLRDVASQFRMKLAPPLSVSPVPVYSTNTLLFDGDLNEVGYLPRVTVSLTSGGEQSDLLVTVLTLDAPTRWEVRLTSGAVSRTAVTDETGMARFEAIPHVDLQNLTLDVVLLEGEQSAGDAGPSA